MHLSSQSVYSGAWGCICCCSCSYGMYMSTRVRTRIHTSRVRTSVQEQYVSLVCVHLLPGDFDAAAFDVAGMVPEMFFNPLLAAGTPSATPLHQCVHERMGTHTCAHGTSVPAPVHHETLGAQVPRGCVPPLDHLRLFCADMDGWCVCVPILSLLP